MSQSIRPSDILSDHKSSANFNGITVRKGSIAAFLKNIEIIENPNISEKEKTAAYAIMKELAPALIAVDLYKYATFKNSAVQNILDIENKR